MELTITQTEMPLLSLTKVTGTLKFQGKTPSYTELKQQLATKTKAQPDLIQLRHIYTDFRSQSATFSANIYKNKETFDKFLTKKEKEAIKKAEEESKKKANKEKKAAEEIKKKTAEEKNPKEQPAKEE